MIQTQPWSGGTGEEYETQHFGFGSQRFKIAVRQMVEQKIKNGIKDMESYLQDSLQLNEKDKATLTRSSDTLIKLYYERAESPLESIDAEIERIVNVPSNVLLPGDECQIEQLTDEDYEKLQEEVASLRKRIERAVLMEVLLTGEEKELASMETVCETARKDMEVFDSLITDYSIKTTVNETMFLCASAGSMPNDYDFDDICKS